MTQTTLDLLKDAQAIFNRIHEFEASPSSLTDVLELIDRMEPPASWVIELPSQIKEGTYKTIPLDLMEAAVKRIFGQESGISRVDAPIITQDRNGRFSATVSLAYKVTGDFGAHYLTGMASVTSPNIQGLELATPKAKAMAIKNALRDLGGLFGKYLNKVEDQEITESPAESLEERLESLPETLRKVENLEDLKSYRRMVYSKSMSPDIQAIYEEKLRQFKQK
jgi:hypothetical protein